MEAWIPVVLSVVGSGGVLVVIINGIGKWIARLQDERDKRELGYLTKIEKLEKLLFDEQQARLGDHIKRLDVTDNNNKLLIELTGLLKASLSKGQTQ